MLSFKPSITIDYQIFANLLLGDLTRLSEEIEKISHLVRRSSNYEYDNSIIRTSSSYGTEFKTLLSGRLLNLWDIHDFSVAFEKLPDNIEERKKILANIGQKISRYDNGIISCSKCGKEIELQLHTQNRFYAGIYCNECWKNGICQQESKENYN